MLNNELYHLLSPWSSPWEANRFEAISRNTPHFIEPESSLPHSQVPAICPYPEPARYCPYPHIPYPWRSTLILCSHLCVGLPSGLFLSGFPTNTLYTHLLSHHARCVSHPSHKKWALTSTILQVLQFLDIQTSHTVKQSKMTIASLDNPLVDKM